MKNNKDYAKLLKEVEEGQLKKEYEAKIKAKIDQRKKKEVLYRANNAFDLRPKSIIKSIKFEILIFGFGILGILGTFYFLKESQRQTLDDRFTKKGAKYDLTDRSFMSNKVIEDSKKIRKSIEDELFELDDSK